MSDLNFLHTVAHSLGLRQYSNLGMITSLDHSMWFVSGTFICFICSFFSQKYDNFDAGEWLIYRTFCPVSAHGRGNVQGEFWSQDGRLVALTAQQGLVREKRPEARL